MISGVYVSAGYLPLTRVQTFFAFQGETLHLRRSAALQRRCQELRAAGFPLAMAQVGFINIIEYGERLNLTVSLHSGVGTSTLSESMIGQVMHRVFSGYPRP